MKQEVKLTQSDFQKLYKSFLTLENEKEVQNFLRDLMTIQEIETFATRLKVAFLLTEDVPYREIAAQTGASTATITRVNNWLVRGMGGYRKVIKNQQDKKSLHSKQA